MDEIVDWEPHETFSLNMKGWIGILEVTFKWPFGVLPKFRQSRLENPRSKLKKGPV